jgi:tetratricopeptide (TPR) repeat protein
MSKICLLIIGLFVLNQVKGQTSPFLTQQTPPVNAAVNIVVSNLDENDGDSYFADAEKNERRGDLNDAITLFGKAAFEYNSSKKFTQYGSALLRLANVHYLLAHYSEAEQVTLNVALKNYSKIGSRTGQMESYSQLGKIYLAADKLTQSLWFYTQQGILAKQVGDNNAYIDSILGLAQVKTRKKEYTLALKDLNRAELLAKSSNLSRFKTQIREAKAQIPAKVIAKK